MPAGKNKLPHSIKNLKKYTRFIQPKIAPANVKLAIKWAVTVKLIGKRPNRLYDASNHKVEKYVAKNKSERIADDSIKEMVA